MARTLANRASAPAFSYSLAAPKACCTTTFTEAASRGVEVLAYACEISLETIRIAHSVPWIGARLAGH